ncbi:MAG: DUF4391 domain-containing protein [Actinobacteria bacterium]|nr:DUF4391 domain-containing protein [Actinomycetota bacterium]
MLNFPKTTEFNKRIPKQKFYNKLKISSTLEQQFVKEIETIYWKNKLSADTLNVSAGNAVKEIEIIEINLKEKNISKNIIEIIDREIPYHIVFILRFKDLAQIYISFKEDSKNRESKFKVNSYFKTEWLNYEELSLEITGLTLDKIYENFIIQVAGNRLQVEDGTDIKEAVLKVKEKERLEFLTISLESKIKNEKQYNFQVKLAGELRKVKKQLRSK